MVMEENTLFNEMFNELFPVLKRVSVSGDVAVTLGGSHGKGFADIGSDYDICIYCEEISEQETLRLAFGEINALSEKWRERGVIIDGPWVRTYADIDTQINLWLSGMGAAVPVVWSIWGYHILTNISNQTILSDPFGRVAGWIERLSVYPEALRNAVIKKHTDSLRYWRSDYHYQNKVRRGDVVFLSSITARLIHDIMQVLFALNSVYYPGDGANLDYVRGFARKPDDFEGKVTAILLPVEENGGLAGQYDNLVKLIDEVLALV